MKRLLSILSFFFIITNLWSQQIELTVFKNAPDTGIIYSLKDCIDISKNNNKDIKNAKLTVLSAKETKKMAFTKYFPNVSMFGLGFIFNKPFIDADIKDVDINISSPNANINNLIQTFTNLYGPYLPELDVNIKTMNRGLISGLTVVQPVFAGGRIVTGNKLAGIGIEAAVLQSEKSNDETIKNIEEKYWLLISLQEKQRTVDFFTNMLDTLNNNVQVAYDAGLITKTEVLKVKLKKNELKSKEIKLRNGIIMARSALYQAIGLPENDSIVFWESLDTIIEPASVYVDDKYAVNNRTEHKLLEINVEAEKLKHKMILGEALPQLAIGGGGLFNMLMEKPNFHIMSFATMSVPISGWWETSHKLKQQEINIEIAENSRDNYTELLTLQTKQAWNELNESINQLENTIDLINESKENLKISTDYYNAGMLALSDYLQAQGVMQQSLDRYVDDYIVYRKKLSEYKRLTNKLDK